MKKREMAVEELAMRYAERYHAGQWRKKSDKKYITHPAKVVKILQRYGIQDGTTLAIGWLHDAVEDTSLGINDVQQIFGEDIARGVYLLTRNIDNDGYKKRLANAPDNIKLVKLADVLHNVTTLECLSARGIERKIHDCEEFYLPLAEEICPAIGEEIKQCIMRYKEQYEKEE